MRDYNVADIRKHFIGELKDEAFTTDRTGQKTIELIGASFIADEPAIFGTPDKKYIDQEILWYESQSTNINDIREFEDPPVAWKYSANKYGEINSNYGKIIFSDRYYCQYSMVLDELLNNVDTRRANMIYTRPSIWYEYNEEGKNDFICTNAVNYYIRNDEINCVVQMRSNDVVFGYKNDYAWQRYVLEKLTEDYNKLNSFDTVHETKELTPGFIQWQVQNLHIYERHFHLVK
tara:strand:+ start:242 stop:940 length:699 start_codon:yes stop_codon:yes gene_type:complete